MTYSIKKSSAYLTDHQDLAFIFNKVKKLMELNKLILPHLPAYIRDDCQVANIIDKTLILMTSKASAFSQVRFMSQEILQKIKQYPLGKDIKDIQFKVRPSLSNSSTQTDIKQKNMALLSPDTANIVKETADTIADPTLQAIMRRIAERKK